VDDDLARRVLDELELGVLVFDRAVMRVDFANTAARELLRAIDANGTLTEPLKEALDRAVERNLPEGTFTVVDPVKLANGRRLRVRIKRLSAHRVLATMTREHLHDQELFAVMRQRFVLSWRDFQVVNLIRAGCSNAQVGQELNLTVGTVKQYLNRILKSAEVRSRSQLIAKVERLVREEQLSRHDSERPRRG
jgi:DNA-binding CsgD family transcriptional regulator